MPLDSGIGLMGIFCFVLLISFAGIISLIPAEFVNTIGYSNPADKVPETWNGIELGGYNFTAGNIWNITMTNNDVSYYFDIGGRNLRFATNTILFKPSHMRLFHRYGFGLLWEEAMDWFNTDNEDLSSVIYTTILDETYEEYGNLEFEVICAGLGSGSSYFKVTSLLSFNTTDYDTPTEAWTNDDLDILIGINAENTNYQQDIWYLISNLLSFNTLYIFGTTDLFAVILNGIIAGFIYVCVIVFATAIILEVLPF